MRKLLMSLTVIAGAALAAGSVAHARPMSGPEAGPAAVLVPMVAPAAPAEVVPVQYYEDWRHREWRRREAYERWRRHEEWRRHHAYRGW